MYEKHFDAWIKVKKKLQYSNKKIFFHEREVWWCSIGENIGVEMNGKGQNFERPVVIFYKLSRDSFLGVPLSTQKHDGTWFVPFNFNDRDQTAFLSQIRVMAAERLTQKIGELSDSDFLAIGEKLFVLYFKKILPNHY